MTHDLRSQRLALLAILAMTAAWGSTFFMIKEVLGRIPVTDLLALRFSLAAVAMMILAGRRLRMSVRALARGVGLGALYGVAQLLQTYGLARTDASVSGFITGLYVVATPLLAAVLFRARVTALTWVAVLLATVGLGVLSLHGLSVGLGQLLTLASALVYALHIILLARLSRPGEELGLATVQIIVVAVVCLVAALPQGIHLPQRGSDWLIIVYLALIAGALTMFLQTWAQARIPATRAAVIMAMEPVWAAGFAVALGGEPLTWRILLGGLVIIVAMYLVELGPSLRDRRRNRHPDGHPDRGGTAGQPTSGG